MVLKDIYADVQAAYGRCRRLMGRLVGQVMGQSWLWLLVWMGILLVLHSPQQSLMAQDEGYYAQQARWMLANQDWITVGWWGQPLYDRTIGLQWLIAFSYHLMGRSEVTARLPSMIASVVAVMLTWRIGMRLVPSRAGLWGAAIFAAMPLWMQTSKLATQDACLVALELVTIWALLRSEDDPSQRRNWGLVAGMALSLGFLFKGVMVVLPAVALLPYLVRSHHTHRHLANRGLYYGLGLGAIPTVVWLGFSVARYGWLPLQQLFGKVLLLAQANSPAAEAFQSTSTVTYYLWHIPATTFPWVGFALVGAWLVGRHPSVGRRTLWLGYPLVLLVLLSGFDTRTWYYSLQLYPFVALLAAVGLDHLGRLFRSAAPRRYWVAVGLSWAAGVFGILLMSAGLALMLTPGDLISPELRPYGWLGLMGGLGWLLPWRMAINRPRRVTRRVTHREQQIWQWGWLLGPWLAIAAAFVTGLFGNYEPAFVQALKSPPLDSILATNSVDFVRPGGDRESILFTFYTPHLGQPLSDWSQMPSEGYAWGNPELVPMTEGYEVVATVEGWHLVRAPLVPAAVPKG